MLFPDQPLSPASHDFLMKLHLVGWSFHGTPVEFRDRLSLGETAQVELADRLRNRHGVRELVILSTCNRFELYCAGSEGTSGTIIKTLVEDLGELQLGPTAYLLEDIEAVRHLFRVTSSLDSMVLGEPQIFGQVKDAYRFYTEAGWTGKLLNPIFSKAFRAAKRVRSETGIASNAVSVSYAAVQLARQIFEDLSGLSVMMVGAGEMAELALEHLVRNGLRRLMVVNRTFANAVRLAERYGGVAIQFRELESYLADADIVITSTGATSPIINVPMVQDCLRNHRERQMFFIDIAVPRDVHPEVHDLPGAYCYDIDDLQNVVSVNQAERLQQAEEARQLLEEELVQVRHWFQELSVVPAIRKLRKTFEKTAEAEVQRFLNRSKLDATESEEVQRMVRRILNKLLHSPSRTIRKFSGRDDQPLLLELLHELHNLPTVPESAEPIRKQHLSLVKR